MPRLLFLNDPVFGAQTLTIPAQLWPKGSLRYLVRAGQFCWRRFRLPLNADALQMIVETDDKGLKRAGTEPDHVLQVYVDLCAQYGIAAANIPVARAIAEDWLRNRLMAFGLEQAQAALVAGDVNMVQEIVRKAALAPQANGQGFLACRGTGFEAQSSHFVPMTKYFVSIGRSWTDFARD